MGVLRDSHSSSRSAMIRRAFFAHEILAISLGSPSGRVERHMLEYLLSGICGQSGAFQRPESSRLYLASKLALSFPLTPRKKNPAGWRPPVVRARGVSMPWRPRSKTVPAATSMWRGVPRATRSEQVQDVAAQPGERALTDFWPGASPAGIWYACGKLIYGSARHVGGFRPRNNASLGHAKGGGGRGHLLVSSPSRRREEGPCLT